MSLDDQYSVIGKVLDASGNVREFGIDAGLQGQILTCNYNFPNVFTFADPIPGVTGAQGATGPIGPTGPSNPNATNINITDTNTNATYYPTFVAGSGTQSLLADISTSAISFNVSNGDFNVVDTLKLTQTSVAIGKSAGQTNQQANAIAIGNNAGQLNQQTGAIAIGYQAGQGYLSMQGANSIAIGNLAGADSQVAGSICLNASGTTFNPNTVGFHVNPIRLGLPGSTFSPALPPGVLYFDANEILRTG